MKVPGITIPDVPEAGRIDGDEMLLVLENNELRLKTLDMARGAFKFPDFAPRLLASLAASSTAACTSGVVTVTAAAHGIGATNFNGFSFYYPGSASLAAGWYAEFNRTGVDSITFSAPGAADFASESVNGGAAITSEVTLKSITLPANIIASGRAIRVPHYRASNSSASTKTLRLKGGSATFATHASTSTTTIIGPSEIMCFAGSGAVFGNVSTTGALTDTISRSSVDFAVPLVVSLTGQISSAGQYLAVIAPSILIL